MPLTGRITSLVVEFNLGRRISLAPPSSQSHKSCVGCPESNLQIRSDSPKAPPKDFRSRFHCLAVNGDGWPTWYSFRPWRNPVSDKTRWRQGCFLASTADKVETYAIRLGGWVGGRSGRSLWKPMWILAEPQLDKVEEAETTCLCILQPPSMLIRFLSPCNSFELRSWSFLY